MVKVALVKGDERKANIRRALDLINDDINLKGRRQEVKRLYQDLAVDVE